MLKEFNFNKLRQGALFCLSLCADVVKIEMTGLPDFLKIFFDSFFKNLLSYPVFYFNF